MLGSGDEPALDQLREHEGDLVPGGGGHADGSHGAFVSVADGLQGCPQIPRVLLREAKSPAVVLHRCTHYQGNNAKNSAVVSVVS